MTRAKSTAAILSKAAEALTGEPTTVVNWLRDPFDAITDEALALAADLLAGRLVVSREDAHFTDGVWEDREQTRAAGVLRISAADYPEGTRVVVLEPQEPKT